MEHSYRSHLHNPQGINYQQKFSLHGRLAEVLALSGCDFDCNDNRVVDENELHESPLKLSETLAKREKTYIDSLKETRVGFKSTENEKCYHMGA